MNNRKLCLNILAIILLLSCNNSKNEISVGKEQKPKMIELSLAEANRLAELPLECISNPLPYKPGHTIATETDLEMPQIHHPAFYGCFDWHSAVHGHWSLVYLMKEFPDLAKSDEARKMLNNNLTKENIEKEPSIYT